MIYGILRSKYSQLSPLDIEYRSFKHFKEEAFLSDLQPIPFSVVSTFDDPGDSLCFFSKLLTGVVNDHAPLKKKRIRNKQPAFFNLKFKKAVMHKRHLLRKYKIFPTRSNWEAFRKQRYLCTDMRCRSIKSYFRERCFRGPKNEDFWDMIKPFVSNKFCKSEADLMVDEDNNMITDPNTVANGMNASLAANIGKDQSPPVFNDRSHIDFVASSIDHFNSESHQSIFHINNSMAKCNFNFKHIEVKDITCAIKQLNPKKATGFDLLKSWQLHALLLLNR